MLIKHINSDTVGQTVTLSGWVDKIRSSGKIAFISLRDGTEFIQCVIEEKHIGEAAFADITALGPNHHWVSQEISETSQRRIRAPGTMISDLYPNTWLPNRNKDDHGPDFLFDHRHLYLRSQSQWAIQRIRDTIIHATYDWMRQNDVLKIDAPIFTPSACEGTTELYEVEHVNGEKMYLSQSGQLYIEAAIAAHGRVFDFGPVFRAEHSKTRRHLNEFWMMDAEFAFIQQDENMEPRSLSCIISSKKCSRKIVVSSLSSVEM